VTDVVSRVAIVKFELIFKLIGCEASRVGCQATTFVGPGAVAIRVADTNRTKGRDGLRRANCDDRVRPRLGRRPEVKQVVMLRPRGAAIERGTTLRG
jgi:hypothetical protein